MRMRRSALTGGASLDAGMGGKESAVLARFVTDVVLRCAKRPGALDSCDGRP